MTFFCPYKNSYLQTCLYTANINPRLLNRMVNSSMGQNTDSHDKEPPLQRLTSDQPCLPAQRSDFLCRPLAFGRWAMPKLIRELHSDCPEIVASAINSIMDLIHDPERSFEAINLKLVDRIADLMLHEDPIIRERVIIILTTIAYQELGRQAICKCELTLTNILKLLEDKVIVVRIKATKLTLTLTDSWMACSTLIKYDFIETIHHLLSNEGCGAIIKLLLQTFKQITTGEGKNIAFSLGAYDTLVTLLNSEVTFILQEALGCLAVIMTLKRAKKRAVEKNLLSEYLNDFIMHYRSEVHTAAAEVIMYATIRTKAKKQCAKIPGFLDRLLLLSFDKSNPRLQMFVMKALTNLVEYPPNRQYILDHKPRLRKIPIDKRSHMPHADLKLIKTKFIETVQWKP